MLAVVNQLGHFRTDDSLRGRALNLMQVKKAGPESRTSHERFGSLADIAASSPDVRFTPKSGHH
jgi:hypothetical protein